MECLNCYIDYSPIWRRGYCNACGIHYQKHGVHKDVATIYAKVLMSFQRT